MTSWARVRVPASSANLGPGFDAIGLALAIYLECLFRPSDALAIRVSGDDSQSIPQDASNLIWQTASAVAAHVGLPLPPIDLEIRNRIPLGKGLGSSAAAVTAGVVIADHLLRLNWPRTRILDEAARLEGHPDNVAACVFGGIVVSAIDDEGHACAIRLELPAGCEIALLVPDFVLPTSRSRAALPNSYTREDVVFNLQRSGLLVAALATGRTDVLATALADRLHQPYRAELVPGFSETLALRVSGLFGCVLSGAGPSVLVFFEAGRSEVCRVVQDALGRGGTHAFVLPASVATQGYLLDI